MTIFTKLLATALIFSLLFTAFYHAKVENREAKIKVLQETILSLNKKVSAKEFECEDINLTKEILQNIMDIQNEESNISTSVGTHSISI